MKIRNSFIPQVLVNNTINSFKKYAQDVSGVIAQDSRLLVSLFGVEDFVKLASYCIQEDEKQQGFDIRLAKETTNSAFATLFLRAIKEQAHDQHFSIVDGDKEEGAKDTFKKELIKAAEDFYPITYSTLLKLIPKRLAAILNSYFSPQKYTLYEGLPGFSKELGSVVLQLDTEKEKSKYIEEALDAFDDKGLLDKNDKFTPVLNKEDLQKINGYNELDDKKKEKIPTPRSGYLYVEGKGRAIRRTVSGDVNESDIRFSGKELESKIEDMVLKVLFYYMRKDPKRVNKLILDSVYGAKGKSQDLDKRKDVSESQEYFIPRIDAETREKKLKQLKKEQNLPENAKDFLVTDADKYAINKVDKEALQVLQEYQDFTIKPKYLDEGSGKDLKKRMDFYITDVPKIDKNRLFSIEVPEFIQGINLGKTYTVEVKPAGQSDKKIILDFVSFSEDRDKARLDITRERGLGEKEIRTLILRMATDYVDINFPKNKETAEELVQELSGQVTVNGVRVYDMESLAGAIAEKDVTEKIHRKDPEWEQKAIQKQQEIEQEEEEAEEETKSFWGDNVYEEISKWVLSQGASKSRPLIEKIASNFPNRIVGKGDVATNILYTKPFVTWVLKTIGSVADVEEKGLEAKKLRLWLPIVMKKLSSGEAFKDENMQELLEMIPIDKDLDLKDKRDMGTNLQDIQDYRDRQTAAAKKIILENLSGIKRQLDKDFIKKIKLIVFDMIKKKDQYLLELMNKSFKRDVYKRILDELYGKQVAVEKAQEKEKKQYLEKTKEVKEKKQETKSNIEEKLKALKEGKGEEKLLELANAIISLDDEKLKTFGFKLSDEAKGMITNPKRMKTRDPQGNPIPYNNLSSTAKDYINKYVKRYLKTKEKNEKSKEQIKKMASIIDYQIEKSAFEIYSSMLEGLDKMSYAGGFPIRLVLQSKRGN